MNKIYKYVLLLVLMAYVVSPADFVPGPIDDMIMILVYALANRRNFGPAAAGKEKYITAEDRPRETDGMSE